MRNSERHLHVVSFNVPFPANYGGVIDVFYKLRALHRQGVRIHLHCFSYGRGAAPALDEICHKVHYYQRKRINREALLSRIPYIVASRNDSELLYNLLQDDYPIMFEGLHCCYHLANPALKDRVKIVRTHNLEDIYYYNLGRIERNRFKRYFFYLESGRLRDYEQILQHATAIAAISPEDARVLNGRYGKTFYLPVFHANDQPICRPGSDEFALYQGNLGVGENNEAALYLVNKVFNEPIFPLVIAGMNPSRELRRAIEGKPHISLRDKVNTAEITRLTQRAHINVLPTFQNTGMKLKLINVLFQGRHIVANSTMVENTGLEPLCHIADSPEEMKAVIQALANCQFSEAEAEKRKDYIAAEFNTAQAARQLLAHVYGTAVAATEAAGS